jgi:hypothetical protein
MKTSGCFGLAFTALAIMLQASSAMAAPRGPGFGQPSHHGYENGFGSNTPVTLPRDRQPPAGKNTGVPVTKTPSSVLINAQPRYFRPR